MVLAAVTWLCAAAWIGLSRDGVDISGRPLGTDFISFWSAGRLLVEGAGPSAPYTPQALASVEAAAFPGANEAFTPFPYPPIFLLLCLPLGALPYAGALAAWLATTGTAYVLVLRRWLQAAPADLLLLLAYPGVLVNAGHGQNGFLSTALLGGGAWALRRRPVAAGLCLGALVFKPHLALLIPVALLAAGAWRTLAATGATAVALIAVSLWAFGPEAWKGFADGLPAMSGVLTTGLLHPGKVQTAFGAAKMLGAGNTLAFAIQAVSAIGAAASVFLLGRRVGAGKTLGASLVSATLITTPYLMAYDLVLAAIPMAWLFVQARRSGFWPWEKLTLLLAFALPALSLALAPNLGIPVAPLVLTALHAAVIRRAWRQPEAASILYDDPLEANVETRSPTRLLSKMPNL